MSARSDSLSNEPPFAEVSLEHGICLVDGGKPSQMHLFSMLSRWLASHRAPAGEPSSPEIEARVAERLKQMTDEAERGLRFARQDSETAQVARIDAEIVLFGAHVPDLLREVERARAPLELAAHPVLQHRDRLPVSRQHER